MSLNLGSGQPLDQAFPWLRDEEELVARILDVTERNSVIEGLPPFTDETRNQIRSELVALIATPPMPAE